MLKEQTHNNVLLCVTINLYHHKYPPVPCSSTNNSSMSKGRRRGNTTFRASGHSWHKNKTLTTVLPVEKIPLWSVWYLELVCMFTQHMYCQVSVSPKAGYLGAVPPIQVSVTASTPKRGWATPFDYCALLYRVFHFTRNSGQTAELTQWHVFNLIGGCPVFLVEG